MNKYLWLLMTLLAIVTSRAQQPDTTNSTDAKPRVFLSSPRTSQNTAAPARLSQTGEHKAYVSMGSITFAAHSALLTPMERQIAELESMECDAVKKRDAVTLTKLWARDFTLDKQQSGVVYEGTTLPNYLSFSRIVESCTPLNEDVVYTSGREFLREVENKSKVEPQTERKFFHTWTRVKGQWKLTTNTND